MSAVIALRHLSVENANAVSGLTWGFPGISHFLGFCHALDRKLCAGTGLVSVLGGCAIVSHSQQIHSASDSYGQHSFAQTRNPVTKEGKTAPFNEEARMHMDVTLLIECKVSAAQYFDALDDDSLDDSELSDEQLLRQRIEQQLHTLRLAGGVIKTVRNVAYIALPDDEQARERASRRLLRQCLPGFALVDRSELLLQHLSALQKLQPQSTLLDAWMDFSALRYRTEHHDPELPADWARVELPETGWLVPLMVGYQGIANLQEAGNVLSARDPNVPFSAVEAVYGVGQWLSPLRAPSLDGLFWHYRYQEPQQYQLHNNYSPFIQDTKGA